MPWARLDDAFWSHPKVVAAGLEATGLHSRALSYVAGHGTSGRLPRDVVKMLAAGRWKTLAARCVFAGLWHAEGDDWIIHDWSDPAYGNPTLTQAQARSEAAKRAADIRWAKEREEAQAKARADAEPHAPRMPDASESHADGNAELMRSDASRRQAPASQSQSQSPLVDPQESPSPAVELRVNPLDSDLSELHQRVIADLAVELHAVRPGWDVPSITAQLNRLARGRKPWPRCVIAMIACTLDGASKYAIRVHEDNYWWNDQDKRTQQAISRWVATGHKNPANALVR